VVERIDDMPAGTIGLQASGKLTRDYYGNTLEPALGEEWVAKVVQMFAWTIPGEVTVYALDQVEEAKLWAAG
jgi:hypothetical protein